MAKLPTREALGQLPTNRRGPIASADLPRVPAGAAIAVGIQSIGKGIGSVGDAALVLQEQDKKEQEFDTERRYQDFVWNQTLDLDQAKRGMKPGQASGFGDNFTNTYIANAKGFMATVPDHLKEKYDSKLFSAERSFFNDATTFARNEQRRFSVNAIDEQLETVFRPRARTVTTNDLDEVGRDYDGVVDANPHLTPIEGDELKRRGKRSIALSHIDNLPPDQVRPLLAPKNEDVTAAGLLRKFEGFRPTAYWDVNAYRTGYGSDTVTLEDGSVVKVTKDTVITRADAERDLERRTSEFANTAAKQVGQDRWDSLPPHVRAALTSVAYNYGSLPKGVVASVQAGDIQGIADSVRSLPANRGRRNEEAAVILSGKVPAGTLGALSDDDRQKAIATADARMARDAQRLAVEVSEGYEKQILDASRGRGELPALRDIVDDPRIDASKRNALIRQYDAAAGDVAGLKNFVERLNSGGQFNPYDSAEKNFADAAFSQLGGDTKALQVIVDKTGIVPKSAATSMRAGINSSDPARVVSALTLATNMLSNNPNIFAAVDGKSDFENGAVAFRHYVDDLGMTAEQAAQKIIKERSPEYKASVKARIKAEDIDANLKKEVTIDDLRGQFDPSWGWMRNPNVAFEPGTRREMFTQYSELVKENYLEYGDMKIAKKLAADVLKRTWGVTDVTGHRGLTGGGIVMQYPPERSPAYNGIDDVGKWFAIQAMESIKEQTGQDVKRENLRIGLIPGVTAQAFKSGSPVPYSLGWLDKDGIVQTLKPGTAFVADPQFMRRAQELEQQQAFELAQQGARDTDIVEGIPALETTGN